VTKTRLPQVAPALTGMKQHFAHAIAAVGQEGFEVAAGLLVMIMVERAYGPAGLGIFAYLMACLFGLRYLSTMGLLRFVEVETARLEDEAPRRQLLGEGAVSVFCLALGASFLLLLTAAFSTSHTRIEERFGAYVLLSLILPVANLNSLKLGILNGLGQHVQVARLKIMRYATILAIIYFLAGTGLAPSLLLVAYLVADIFLAWRLRRHCRLPKLRELGRNFRKVKQTLQHSMTYILTDHGFDLLLNIDFFVLGLFVGAARLGIYAEAAVLVRCSLVFAIALRPLLRRYYIKKASAKPTTAATLQAVLGRHTAIFFSVQSVLALITLLYYPQVIHAVFNGRQESLQSLGIFMVFVPGLIFYTTFLAVEPVYEALHQAEDLGRLTLTVTAANVFLTWTMVPAAGISGAAAATMLTMLLHFCLFGRRLPLRLKPGKTVFLCGAMALYLVYQLLSSLDWHPAVSFWLGPVLLLVAFYGCGLFGVAADAEAETDNQPVIFRLVDEN